MLDVEVNNAVIASQRQILEQALSKNPETEKNLRKCIREVIKEARAQVMSDLSFKHGDPRGSINAVRTSVYKKVLGANINIYSSRKAHGSTNYVPQRKGSTGRGGNRRSRSQRTEQIMSYGPLDRGFILRFISDGTVGRNINFTSNPKRKVNKWNAHPNSGNRSAIGGRNWFRPAGLRALAEAVDNLAYLIDNELLDIFNKKK